MKDLNTVKSVVAIAATIFLLAGSAMFIHAVFQPSWYNNIRAEVTSQPYARTITVDAEGKINVKPDIARINLSVVTQGSSVKNITNDGNQKMTAVINAVKALGVDEKDITSTSYNLSPNYDYSGKTAKITGYTLDQEIQVKVRKLDKVEDALDAGLKAGANQIGQLSFDIDDTSSVKKQSREQAFNKAKEKAQQMASAAGVKLGRVVTFSEGSSYQPAQYNFAMNAKSMVQDEAVGASIQAGTKDITVSVSVTYEIE